ncbi:MAG: dipeptidase [Deinococcaceae bacterium]
MCRMDLSQFLDTQTADAELFELLRIPSVSTDPSRSSDMRHMAQVLETKLLSLGFQVRIDETGGHPLVFAHHHVSDQLPTVLIYGHYDVQPEDPIEGWLSPPFEPTVRDGRVYARGATDDKGQFYAHVRAVELLLKKGPLPCNVKFLIEGEEEIGSTHLGAYIQSHAQDLSADVIVISDGSRFDAETPSITYGLRGLSYMEIHVTGADRDLHSGSYGGAAPNPINALCQMVAQLHDAQGRVAVPGFYDGVLSLSAEERKMWEGLPHSDSTWAAAIGAKEIIGEAGYSTLEKIWGRPTLDCNGIWGGFQGEGSKTVIPARAGAKLSCRLVSNQNAHQIYQKIHDYILAIAPKGVSVSVHSHSHGDPMVMDLDSPYLQAAKIAVEKSWGKKPVFTRAGGSIPIALTLKSLLKCPIIFLDMGLNEDNLHSPNESFALSDYHKGIVTSAHLLEEVAQVHLKVH